MTPEWKSRVLHELQAALMDRKAGLEGRARVRCRRAAGEVLAEYFRRRGVPDPWGANALRRMEFAKGLPMPPEARLALEHLTRKVDTNFQLPPDIDLVEDVRTLARVLLKEELTLVDTPMWNLKPRSDDTGSDRPSTSSTPGQK